MKLLSCGMVLMILAGPVMVLAQTCSPPAETESLPHYLCPYYPKPPVLDGRLQETAWDQAPVLRLERCPQGGPPHQPTSVRLYWNEEFLFVGARMVERDMRDSFSERDDPVYMEQAFEVFLTGEDGAGAPTSYLEVDVSPGGTIFDAEIFNPRPSLDPRVRERYMNWDLSVSPPHLQAVTRRRGTLNQPGDVDWYWTVELKIPWSAVPEAQDRLEDTVWRMNLNRISGQRDELSREFQTWSALGEVCFHQPGYFGIMTLQR